MKKFLAHLFIPQESNNFRVKFLHHKILLVFILFFLLTPITKDYLVKGQVLGTSVSFSKEELVSLTNAARQENGLSKLTDNELLDNAALAKGQDMLSKDYWAHISPDGTTPWYFIKNAGYEYIYAGENLAKGFNSPQDAINAWMNSPLHRENILSPNFQDVGFAVLQGNLQGEETTLIVQEFGGKNLVPEKAETPGSKEQKQNYKEDKNILGNPTLIVPQTKSQDIVLFVLGLFVIVLSLDLLFAKKSKAIRVVGHNLDHLLLFSFLILVLFYMMKGAVL